MDINEIQDRARQGDRAAEGELFRVLLARFRVFARQRLRNEAEAEEAVQDALKTVFEKYRSTIFDTSFTAWAYQVMKNRLLTHAATVGRRERRRVDIETVDHEMAVEQADRELERRLLNCLGEVNRSYPRHARILNLHYQGYEPSDICERLGLTRTNFYTILSRARAALESCLEKGESR